MRKLEKKERGILIFAINARLNMEKNNLNPEIENCLSDARQY